MKKGLLLTLVMLVSLATIYAAPFAVAPKAEKATMENTWKENLQSMSLDDIMTLTPKKYREMTGKRMGVANAVKLKVAQTVLKKNSAKQATDLPKAAYVILALIGLGWLAMGLLDSFEGNNWWIGLLLYFLGFLPGLIFTLIKMGDYY
ncbi:MAG: hypothetical protein AAGI23_00740 [Bacteroidota bacterium]